ncbi:MAG: adenosylmethionine--8-amino-7-oxononanoate transaminase [Planctomycetes bacterium]|nr:adenosylmethionine--8-amino-7-oxononanoate transaminase [Planctomycetota bacterium]
MDDWVKLDRSHVWHPYTQMLEAPPPLPIERAEGVYLYTPDGRKILDGISSWWVNIHGHCHPRLNRALEKQIERLEQVIFAGFTHEPAARLAARLVECAPSGLRRVFYSDDGSTAVEVALKLAAQYWRIRGETRRSLFVAFEHAYHGDTFGAMAAGGIPLFHETFRPLLFEVRRAPSPHSYAFDGGRDPAACEAHCRRELEGILDRDGDRIAAVILEPMLQGAGGMIIWPASFLRAVRELCDAYGVLLIADEVLTGFGRTGKLFACEHGPIEPDILCLSKALTGGYLPLGATLCTDEVHDAFLSRDRSLTFFHGHSYTANALACAVALESLAMIEDSDVLKRVREIESLFRGRIARLRGLPIVGEARGIGAVAAAELRADAASSGERGYLDPRGPRLQRAFLERDILLRPLGDVLYVLPPYVISDEEIHRVFDAIEEVLAEEAS